jgi:hypothetical protein
MAFLWTNGQYGQRLVKINLTFLHGVLATDIFGMKEFWNRLLVMIIWNGIKSIYFLTGHNGLFGVIVVRS